MSDRGKIRNREYAQQINDFSGLRWGSITPTDIDGFVEFGGKLFIFVESKYADAEMTYGQRLALERLCDACHAPPDRNAICFVCSHNTTEGDVNYAECVVKTYRWRGEWIIPSGRIVLRDAINSMRDKYL